MSEKYSIPEKKDRLSRDFFARHADKVALDLLGRYIVVEKPGEKVVYARLHEISAWEGRSESSMNKGSFYAPGTLSISNKFGKNLIDVATLEICRASCVTLIAGMVSDGVKEPELVQGPGNLAKRLGITREYDALPVDIAYVWFGGVSAEPEEIRKRNLTNNLKNFKGQFYLR